MKSRIRWNWSLGLVLAVLPFAGGSPQDSFSQPLNTAPAVETATAPEDALAPAAALPNPALAEQTTGDDEVDAPAKPISTAKPLPASVKATGPVAEVVKLADSGVDESVMLAFVTNSTSTFNLGAEEIIYLNDIGVPSAVVTAMIQRGQVLKALSANAAPVPAAAAPAPVAPAPAALEPAPAPAPTEMAPQPDYTTGTYSPPPDSTYATFYDSLAPYGTWVDVAGYGPCWQPTVVIINPGWQPYCNGGRWVYTDCGWYWLSGYSWGWAPFHYGRWFRHNHMGWCWQPGNTWGPSWVCWRYNGNYCGWAPLPPAAGFSAAVGLTFHGQRVSSSFAFGLGVKSYTFVDVSHFSDHHVNRYALPRQQAAQVYNQTVSSATIVGISTRVVNRGIPVSRVAAASHTQIHKIGIREVHNPGAQGARGERLEGNSRTLSVFRPNFPQSTGTQPAPGGRAQPGPGGPSRSDMRPGSTGVAATPPPAAPRLGLNPSPQTFGGSTAFTPNSTGRFGRRPEQPAAGANAAPTTATGSTPVPARRTSDPAPRLAEPLILRGSDSSRQVTGRSSVSAAHEAGPPNALIFRGQREGNRAQAAGLAPPPVTAVPRQDTFSHQAVIQRPQPFMTAEAQAPSEPRGSIPRATESHVRTERPQQYSAPTYSAPVQVPRSAPAPALAPQPVHSYAPPAASPAARAEATTSQPARSSAAPPAASSHSSSSGRNWR